MRFRQQHATRPLHDAVERHFNLGGDCRTTNEYCGLLAKLWQLYAPLEQALCAIDWRHTGIAIEGRRKTPWLEADLVHLGMSTASVAALELCHDLPVLDCAAAGLGALYVLEGSTLGGRVILKLLRPRLGVSPINGGQFFASYGEDVGVMWRRYLDVLEAFGYAPRTADRIEQAALETFSAFDRWFGASAARKADERYAHV